VGYVWKKGQVFCGDKLKEIRWNCNKFRLAVCIDTLAELILTGQFADMPTSQSI